MNQRSINQNRSVYERSEDAYTDTTARKIAGWIIYDKGHHHAYVDSKTMLALKTIPSNFLQEMQLSDIRIQYKDDPSISNRAIVFDACKKSFHCNAPMLIKWVYDISSICYALGNNQTPTAAFTSLFVDCALVCGRYIGITDYNYALGIHYTYPAHRIVAEAGLLMFMYMKGSTKPIDFFGTSTILHSTIPYLLATIPFAYYVRKHEQFPHTSILGQKKNSCTIL